MLSINSASPLSRARPATDAVPACNSFDRHHPFAAGADLAGATPLDAFAYAAPQLLERFLIVPTLEQLLGDIDPARQLAALAPFHAFPVLEKFSLGKEYSNAQKAKNLLDGIRMSACGKFDNGKLTFEHLRTADKSSLFDSIRNGDAQTIFNLSALAWDAGIGSCEELTMAAGLLMKAQGYPHQLAVVVMEPVPLPDGAEPDHALLSSDLDGVTYFFDPLMHLLKFSDSYDFPTPALNFRSMYAAPTFDDNFRFTSVSAGGQLKLCNHSDLDEQRRNHPLKLAGTFENGPAGPYFLQGPRMRDQPHPPLV